MLPWSERFSRSRDQMRWIRIKSHFYNRRIQGPVLRDKIGFYVCPCSERTYSLYFGQQVESRLIRTNCQSLNLVLIKK